mgnify:CR=1 FL=1
MSAPTRGPWIEIFSQPQLFKFFIRRPPHGGRGLKSASCPLYTGSACRPPHGGRGLKSCHKSHQDANRRRPPHGGRGLKCDVQLFFKRLRKGRPPHGGRGLKYRRKAPDNTAVRRPPHGGRGLKYPTWMDAEGRGWSAPTRGPWIEIVVCQEEKTLFLSAPTRGPWIEILLSRRCISLAVSAPTRGPWIEMLAPVHQFSTVRVGPHTGAVD